MKMRKSYFTLFRSWKQSTRADFKRIALQIVNNVKIQKQMGCCPKKKEIYDFLIEIKAVKDSDIMEGNGNPKTILKKLLKKELEKKLI